MNADPQQRRFTPLSRSGYPPSSGREAISIGLCWMVLTVAFEFVFFRYAGGHSWSELLGNFNVTQGRVWVIVLAWLLMAPYVFYRRDSSQPAQPQKNGSEISPVTGPATRNCQND